MVTSKFCPRCNTKKNLSSFYSNRQNLDNCEHDVECKTCVQKYVVDKVSLQDYCKKNNRRYVEDLFQECKTRIENKYKDDPDANSMEETKRFTFLMDKTIKDYFKNMNRGNVYEYVPDVKIPDEEIEEDIEQSEDEEFYVDDDKKEKKIWSDDWQGNYTEEQINWLDKYYTDTCEDFNVKTRNHKDYARKIAKASLAMDEAYNDMMNGVIGADKKYDKAKSIFDTLSNSAKFSEKTRSTNDVAGLGSLSEIVAKLEQTGFLQKKIEFEEDHIDKINEDFRWTISSVGGDL